MSATDFNAAFQAARAGEAWARVAFDLLWHCASLRLPPLTTARGALAFTEMPPGVERPGCHGMLATIEFYSKPLALDIWGLG